MASEDFVPLVVPEDEGWERRSPSLPFKGVSSEDVVSFSSLDREQSKKVPLPALDSSEPCFAGTTEEEDAALALLVLAYSNAIPPMFIEGDVAGGSL